MIKESRSKDMSKRKRVLISILLLVFTTAISIFVGYRFNTSAQAQQRSGPPDLLTANRRVVELDEPEWRQNIPLTALASESKVIAIGVPIRNGCHRSQDGYQVTTDYEVRLQEVIKGDFQSGSVISLSMPGGLVTEPDRSLLEVRARRVRKMRNGNTYVLFLKKAPAGANTELAPVRGSQGLYEIPQGGTRVIHLGRSTTLPPADDGEEIPVFLQSVRDIVLHH